MNVLKIGIKLFVENATFGHDLFVPIFHRWIQNQAMPGHLLIDVADYEHVHAGPGTLLIAQEANLGMDRSEDRLGLLYLRKQPVAGAATLAERLKLVMADTLAAAAKLEAEPELAGKLRFRTDEISVRFNDRLLTPNTQAAYDAVQPAVQALAAELFPGKPVRVEPVKLGSQQLLEAQIVGGSNASATALAHRLAAPAA